MSIVAVGTVALDTIETPFGKADKILGGSATYISLAARYFTSDVHLVAIVGSDFPEVHLDLLQGHGIRTDGLDRDDSGETFAWEGKYHYDLNDRQTVATHLNVLTEFSPNVPDSAHGCRIACLGNLDPQVQREALAQLDGPELVICDTMNYWIERTRESLEQTLKLVDCLIINDSEARQLANEPNLIRAAAIIRKLGPETLVIKKGEHGALLFTDGSVFSAPAFPLEDIYDPTGAGDTFMGGFAGYLCHCRDYSPDGLKKAVVYGSAMASFVVEKFGADRLLELSEDEIDERVRKFRLLSEIPQIEPLRVA